MVVCCDNHDRDCFGDHVLCQREAQVNKQFTKLIPGVFMAKVSMPLCF